MTTVKVIGAGLAGSEAAWQLAQRGICVELYREQQDAFLVDREHAPAISYSREFVSGLVGKLRRMSVTPTGLLEAVDDELSAQQLL